MAENYIDKYIIGPLIIFFVLFPPLIHGSVTIFPLSISQSAAFLLFFAFALRSCLKNEISFVKFFTFPALLFIALILLQLLALPRDFLAFLSPATAALYEKFGTTASAYCLSVYRQNTLNMLIFFLSCLAVFFTVLNYLDTKEKIRRLLSAIIFTGFAFALYGIARRLFVAVPEFSTFTNRNHFAAYMGMVIPLAITYSFLTTPARSLIFGFIAVVEMLALFLSLSRAGIVSFALSVLILLFLLWVKKRAVKKIAIVIPALLGLIIFLALIGLSPVAQRLGTLMNGSKAFSGRAAVLKDSLSMIADFPFFGTGLGTFGDIFQKYRTFPLHFDVTYHFAHNEPAQLLVECGLIGLVLIFFFLASPLKNIFSLWLRRRDSFAVHTALGGLISIVFIMLHSQFDFIMHIPANGYLFFIVLALTFRAIYIKDPPEALPLPRFKATVSQRARPYSIAALFIIFVFFEMLVFSRLNAESLFEKIKEEKISEVDIAPVTRYKKILKKIGRAVKLSPMNSVYADKEGDILLEIALRDDLLDYLPDIIKANDQNEALDLAKDKYEKAIALNPAKAEYHLKLGWVYEALGKADLRQEEFGKALLLDPQNIGIKTFIEGYKK